TYKVNVFNILLHFMPCAVLYIVFHASSLSNRARAVSAVLINTVSDANWAGHRLKLLTSNPLVRALRHRHLREDRRSLQPPPIPKKRLSNLVSGILFGINVRRIAHGVIGPLLLIERLNPQHVVK